jgi:hypothetical protein
MTTIISFFHFTAIIVFSINVVVAAMAAIVVMVSIASILCPSCDINMSISTVLDRNPQQRSKGCEALFYNTLLDIFPDIKTYANVPESVS